MNIKIENGEVLQKGRNKNTVKIVRMYKCVLCNEKFSNKTILSEHKLTHNTIKPYECMYCDYKCSLKDIMKNHLYITHGRNTKRIDIVTTKKYELIIQEYKCMICNGQFATKKEVHNHHLVNKLCKPDACSYCDDNAGKSNTQKDTSVKEENFTDDDNDDIEDNGPESVNGDSKRMTVYKCTVCPSQFRSKSALYKHNSSHYDLKSFGCQYCDYRCSLKGIMKNHMHVRHNISMKSTDILPDRKDKMFIRAFRCTTCQKVLPSKEHLRNHLLANKDCKRFKCLFCDYKTSMKGTLNRHMLTKHNHSAANIKTETEVSTPLEGTFEEYEQDFKMNIGPNEIVPNIPIKEEIMDDEESSDIEMKYNINTDLSISNSFPDMPVMEDDDTSEVESKYDINTYIALNNSSLIEGIVKEEDTIVRETKYNIDEGISSSNSFPQPSKMEEIVYDEAAAGIEANYNLNTEVTSDNSFPETSLMAEIVKEEETIVREVKYNIDTDVSSSNSEVTGGFEGTSLTYFTEDCIVDGNVVVDTYVKEEIVTDDMTLELFNNKILKNP